MSEEFLINVPDWIMEATRKDTDAFIAEFQEIGCNNPDPLNDSIPHQKAMALINPEDLILLFQLGTQYQDESTSEHQKLIWTKFLDRLACQWDLAHSWIVNYQDLRMLAFPDEFNNQTYYQ